MIRIVSFLTLLALAAPGVADELKTLAGKTIAGTLGKISGSEIVHTSGTVFGANIAGGTLELVSNNGGAAFALELEQA